MLPLSTRWKMEPSPAIANETGNVGTVFLQISCERYEDVAVPINFHHPITVQRTAFNGDLRPFRDRNGKSLSVKSRQYSQNGTIDAVGFASHYLSYLPRGKRSAQALTKKTGLLDRGTLSLARRNAAHERFDRT